MNNKIILQITIRDKLKRIIFWDKVDSFKNKITVRISDDYYLDYVFTKNIASYGTRSTIYDLTEEQLEKMIHKEYKVVKFPFNFIDRNIVMKKLKDSGFEIIPLDNKFYIKMDQNLEKHEIIIGKNRLYIEPIVIIDD